ncbi:MAG: hypothetical protein KGL94_08500 [Acidobacteriota bacterium]|nr:hypothetical protein [Acidobacteriota bacterium]
MARPAPRMQELSEQPSVVELRYRYHRAQRHARVRQREENRLARYRFYVALTVLLVITGAFVVGAWREIYHLFGL